MTLRADLDHTAGGGPAVPGSSESCCCGPGAHAYAVTVRGPLGPSALQVSGADLVPGPVEAATPLFMSAVLDHGGGVLLAASGDAVLGVADSMVSVGSGPGVPWLLEVHPEVEGSFTARLADGRYLAAAEDGAPVRLVDDVALASALVLTRHGAPRPHASSAPDADTDVPRLGWAAEPGHWNDPSKSTHLWLFHRARELILDPSLRPAGFTANHAQLRALLRNTTFLDAVARGIDAADNSGELDVATSGFIYSAHFYHPQMDRGGPWDPDPRVNARNYGRGYFQQSLELRDTAKAGRALGLSIHYLTDVCQPMHAALVPNNPLWWLTGGPLGYHHGNYELWTLSVQDDCVLPPEDLDLSAYSSKADWWMIAAKAGLAEAKAWLPRADGPITGGKFAEQSIAEAKANGRSAWVPSTRKMLRVAQTLTVGALLDWAARAAVIAQVRPPDPDARMLFDYSHTLFLVAGMNYDGRVYHQRYSAAEPTQHWVLERVLGPDQQPILSDDGPVYTLRDLRHGKYLVAGDRADGHVYHQDLRGRANGTWALQPAMHDGIRIRKYMNGEYLDGFHLIDQKHHLALVAGDRADNNVYHQPHRDRPNSVWHVMQPLG